MIRALLLLIILPALATGSFAAPYTFTVAKVRDCVDGDTCRVDLDDAHPVFGKVTWRNQAVRLAGINAPELHKAKCDQERALAEKARARLLALLQGAQAITLQVDAEHPREKYGRLLGALLADDKNVGDILVAEGLAHLYTGRGRPKGWCS